MNEILSNALPADAGAAPAAGPRFDLYGPIHKAARLGMTRALRRAGSCDTDDADELAGTLAQLDALLDFCEGHLRHEDDFVHPALERAQPGSAARIADEHRHHVEAIADLRDLVAAVGNARPAQRFAAMQRLYLALALFVADNLQHMDVEESAHNAVLWAHYTDAELLALHDALVASIPAPEMVAVLQWMLPAVSAPERAGMLQGMRAGMPPEAFLGVVQIARDTLAAPDMAKLARALGVPAVPGLVGAT
jgi:hypothetical protein